MWTYLLRYLDEIWTYIVNPYSVIVVQTLWQEHYYELSRILNTLIEL